MSYCASKVSEDLSRYLNKIESVNQIGDLTASAAKCLHFLANHGGHNSWHR